MCNATDAVSLQTEPVAWVALASTDRAIDRTTRRHEKTGNVGAGIRPRIGARFNDCGGDHLLHLAVDFFVDVSTWQHHEQGKAAFAGAGFELEGTIDLSSVALGVHLGLGLGNALSPYDNAPPFLGYEAGLRVQTGPVKLGLDGFAVPTDLLGSKGVIVSVTPTGTVGRWTDFALVAVVVCLSGAALQGAPKP